MNTKTTKLFFNILKFYRTSNLGKVCSTFCISFMFLSKSIKAKLAIIVVRGSRYCSVAIPVIHVKKILFVVRISKKFSILPPKQN